MVAIAAHSWTEAPLFVVHADDHATDTRAQDLTALAPQSEGLFVQTFHRNPRAMTGIGLHRGVAGCGTGLGVRPGVQGNTTNGRQGKRLALRAAQVVGWPRDFEHSTPTPCWRYGHFPQGFQWSDRRRRPFLPASRTMSTGDNDIQVRPGRIRPRQPRRQASADLRRRGDARRQEGLPHRLQLPFRPGPKPVAVRTRPPGDGLDPAPLERPARSDEGARRPPPRHTLPLSAAAQAHRLSEARRRHPRRRRCADVRRHLGRGR